MEREAGACAAVAARISALARADEESVPALVDAILDCAAGMGASDIHIESHCDGALVRYRLDGVLNDIALIPSARAENVFARLKLLARVVTYRKRAPQDGRLDGPEGGALRAAFMPTLHGEKAVLRIAGAVRPIPIDELGMLGPDLAALTSALLQPQGTIFFTGPASSGKSTSIYAALRFLLQHSPLPPNIATLEDPIEQQVDGANQTQIDPSGGLTFLTGLRTVLRMDPNVIVVGEVRDDDTANTAVQAGLSGHLVISTLHCGSAPQVYARLMHMNIERFILASAITAAVAQRLVRSLCPACRRPRPVTAREAARWFASGDPPARVFDPEGCAQCAGSGYAGRTGLFETAVPNDELRDAVMEGAPLARLRAVSEAAGMTSLAAAGASKVRDGATSLAELLRVVGA